MSKSPTKSSGIRMPVPLYNWIDQLAKRHKLTRSQCVIGLVEVARKKLYAKPQRKPKQPWTVNVAWAGMFASVVFLTVHFELMLHVI